jgi:hypothetical protein
VNAFLHFIINNEITRPFWDSVLAWKINECWKKIKSRKLFSISICITTNCLLYGLSGKKRRTFTHFRCQTRMRCLNLFYNAAVYFCNRKINLCLNATINKNQKFIAIKLFWRNSSNYKTLFCSQPFVWLYYGILLNRRSTSYIEYIVIAEWTRNSYLHNFTGWSIFHHATKQ